MRVLQIVSAGVLAFLCQPTPAAEDEVTLFNSSGEAEAYIALTEEMTIYLWSGKPVAYLHSSSAGGFDVYGFNGKHLGWFIRGAIWDHNGDGSCGTKEVMRSTQFEPFKSFKEFKPFKAFKEYAPSRPNMSGKFGETPCRFLLAEGAQ